MFLFSGGNPERIEVIWAEDGGNPESTASQVEFVISDIHRVLEFDSALNRHYTSLVFVDDFKPIGFYRSTGDTKT